MSFYLEKIGKTFYFRLRVPSDLLPYLGTRQLRKSLRTKNRANAKTLARGHLYAAEKLFVTIRSGMLTHEQIREIAIEFKNRFLTNLSEARKRCGKSIYLPTDVKQQIQQGKLTLDAKGENDAIIRFNEAEREKYSEWIQTNDFTEIEPVAKSLLRKKGLDDSPPENELRDLCEYLLKAKIEVCNTVIERMRGNYNNGFDGVAALVAAAPVLPPSPSPAPAKRLSDLWGEYKNLKMAKGAWRTGTLEKNEGSYSIIIDILGNRPLPEFNDEAVIAELLENLRRYPKHKNKTKFAGKPFTRDMATKPGFQPIGNETINFTMGLMSSLLKAAARNPAKWEVRVNLAEGFTIKDKRKASEAKSEYTSRDIEGLFRELAKVRKAVDPHKFYIPLLALYTGARLNELCQLRTEDVSEKDKVLMICINHRPDLDQTTKNGESRCFPIHPTLVKLGFLDHVEKMKTEKQDRLWPKLKAYKGKWGVDFGKWYNRTVEPKFTNDESKSFHSMRHSFVNWFKQNMLEGEMTRSMKNLLILKSIVGHQDNIGISGESEDLSLNRYGKEFPPADQLKLLKCLDYGVDLTLLKR